MAPEGTLDIAISPNAGFSDTGGIAAERAKDALDSLATLLSDALESFRKKVAAAAGSAAEIELSLALALKGSGKWIVVSIEGGATVSVKITWKPQQ